MYMKINDKESNREEEISMFLYCSYDIIGEKVRLAVNKSAQENFLGSLLINNDFKSYGYLTNTNIKFILLIDDTNTNVLKDQDIRAIFKQLHSSYCKAVSNPFYWVTSNLNESRILNENVAEIFST